jgi:hypothetical protein
MVEKNHERWPLKSFEGWTYDSGDTIAFPIISSWSPTVIDFLLMRITQPSWRTPSLVYRTRSANLKLVKVRPESTGSVGNEEKVYVPATI